jgi:hypothetical protein
MCSINSNKRTVSSIPFRNNLHFFPPIDLEYPKQRDHLEDPGLDGRILKKRDGGMDWIDLAQNRDRLKAFVNAVTNLRVSLKCGELGGNLSASQEEICSRDLVH